MATAIFQRARPWLGTLVEMRVEGMDESAASAAVDAAFDEIEIVHRRMSFHAADSDVNRLHRQAAVAPVSVDARTSEVLRWAMRIAAASQGCFDVTVAAQLVQWGFLPAPRSAPPHPMATWRDIELLDDSRVFFRRPLWLDLSGIAKGYAVDRALEILVAAGATQACVNAGGDLRIAGTRAETVHLRNVHGPVLPYAVEIANAAIASSAGAEARRRVDERWHGPHVHGGSRQSADTQHAVSVVAACCVIADALTKVVLAAEPAIAERVLAQFGAQACMHSQGDGWRLLDTAA